MRSSTPSSGALDDPDPLRSIAQLVARWAAAFVLDPTAPTRTKAFGTERVARELRDALVLGEASRPPSRSSRIAANPPSQTSTSATKSTSEPLAQGR
jgi:hypothetical protein